MYGLVELESFRASNGFLWSVSTAFAIGLASIFLWRRKTVRKQRAKDPGLFKKHSVYGSYSTPSCFVYPNIRVFYKEYQNRDKLPKDVPLIVFTHGLGGNATQFLPLLNSLINNASCLAIDLPGCGLSSFAPKDRRAYTTQSLAEFLGVVIERFRDVDNDQKVVLIGHSMGCSINAYLASSTSPIGDSFASLVAGVVAICPHTGARTTKEEAKLTRISQFPPWILSIFRWFDRRGGLHSPSITRVVGQDADDDTRKKQRTFNQQSKSAVFLRFIGGMVGSTGLPGKEVWSGIKVPLFLIASEQDKLCPATQAEQILAWLSPSKRQNDAANTTAPDTTTSSVQSPTTSEDDLIKEKNVSSKHALALKLTVFSSPASHALPYTTNLVRALTGFIENFLASHVDERLGATWQLQHMATSGKWDVKNLTKWQSVDPCSEPISGIFRVMKTMREVDDEHCPKEFVKKFSWKVVPDGAKMVVDLTHETPVYDPQGLEDGGVEYHKFPTVSKQVPHEEEVDEFIKLVDGLRQRISDEATKSSPSNANTRRDSHQALPILPTIGMHCHYGKNRSGYFVCCYLVERCGYKLEDAMDEFAAKRPQGIKHEHFKNELFVRYAVRTRAGTRRNTIFS